MDQDTAPRQRERYFELLRGLSPAERLHKAADLTQAVRWMEEVGIRQRFPQADEFEVRVRLAERLFGAHPALQP